MKAFVLIGIISLISVGLINADHHRQSGKHLSLIPKNEMESTIAHETIPRFVLTYAVINDTVYKITRSINKDNSWFIEIRTAIDNDYKFGVYFDAVNNQFVISTGDNVWTWDENTETPMKEFIREKLNGKFDGLFLELIESQITAGVEKTIPRLVLTYAVIDGALYKITRSINKDRSWFIEIRMAINNDYKFGVYYDAVNEHFVVSTGENAWTWDGKSRMMDLIHGKINQKLVLLMESELNKELPNEKAFVIDGTVPRFVLTYAVINDNLYKITRSINKDNSWFIEIRMAINNDYQFGVYFDAVNKHFVISTGENAWTWDGNTEAELLQFLREKMNGKFNDEFAKLIIGEFATIPRFVLTYAVINDSLYKITRSINKDSSWFVEIRKAVTNEYEYGVYYDAVNKIFVVSNGEEFWTWNGKTKIDFVELVHAKMNGKDAMLERLLKMAMKGSVMEGIVGSDFEAIDGEYFMH